ncbi:hypothetical protein [Shouchella clausii]|uniref:hypothetical protein n=1 Tax=Shouchella clausii TaxID=79880 RepID=UPI0016531A24|nr:hypothetical protein [Shouchella clausii]QNM43718.1 hypothetical protein DUT88_12800 [Shouchella clausii]
MKIGDKFLTRYGTEYEVIQLEKDKRGKTIYRIKFPCGLENVVYYHNVIGGRVKYPYDPCVASVGCIGKATEKGNEKLYHIWRSMLRRCYDKRRKDYNRYGAAGVTVSERWKCFEFFLDDVDKVMGWDESMFQRGLLHLDKDILSGENKMYSLQTCKWVTPQENYNECYSRRKTRDFIAISPEGVMTEENNIKEFAEVHGLHASAISNCISGNQKTSKGWRFMSKEELYA